MFNFSKSLKECKILYCEDVESIRMTFSMMLDGRADNITYAEDGKIGLDKYRDTKPDIIITDIEMPNKSGLEMISEIRELNSDIPIIITTSKGDQESLLSAIDMGVDKFLIKPVRSDILLLTLQKVLLTLEDKKIAEEYRRKMEMEKLQENTKQIISQLSEIFIEPIMITQETSIKYFNKAFEKYFGEENINSIKNNCNNFNLLLERRDNFSHTLNDLSIESPYDNIISTNINNKRKIFQVVVDKIHFKGEDKESNIYVFQDITTLEYQKLKIQNYSFRLENYLIDAKYKTKKIQNVVPLSEPLSKEKHIDKSVEVKEINNIHEQKRALSELEEGLLRKSHVYKISAEDFVKSIDSTIYEDLDELKEVEMEIDENLYDFLEAPSMKLLHSIVSSLEKYAFAIKNLQEFDELAQALFSTRDILSAISEIDNKKAEKVEMFLKNIFDDLKSWRTTIFVEKNTEDIHYLDSSLFSSCLQMELSLTGIKADDEEDDFELF